MERIHFSVVCDCRKLQAADNAIRDPFPLWEGSRCLVLFDCLIARDRSWFYMYIKFGQVRLLTSELKVYHSLIHLLRWLRYAGWHAGKWLVTQ